nr:hypothetical protein [Tanacetum cinerariifolium]
MTDYSLWEVILNGDSPAPTKVVKGVLQPVAPTTAEQRLARKNELKAHGTLLMALPDKHQLKFNSHKDAKTLIEAIEKRFGGNTETKKVQKTLLKQRYKNFSGSSTESLDQIHDRLQKLISQLKILGVSLSQEDINLNLKIYKAEVKSSSSANTSTQNIAFVSSSNTDNTNESVSTAASVSAVSPKIHVSPLPNVDSLSNVVICSFFSSQSNSPQLDNDDLKKIDADDLEEMDLKWQMAMLTVRARRFLQRTGRNLGANGPTSIDFDMPNVECYNCHRKGHFAKECSYNWSFQSEEEPTNYALMAFSSLSSSSDNEVVSCSKACIKAYAQLQSHYDKLTADFQKSQFDVISYQTGLESVKARLLVYKQNESVFKEDIKLLKFEVQLRDNALVGLKQTLEKAKQKRDDLKLKLEKFQTSSKNLTKLLASQTNAKTDNGYHDVPPPYTGTFMPPKLDLVFNNVSNAVETDHPAFNVKLSLTKPDQDFSLINRPSAPIIEDWVSDSEDESQTKTSQNVPSFVQSTEQVKSPMPSVQYVETSIPAATPKPASPKPTSNGKQRNIKACFVCKSLDHLIKDCDYHEMKMAQPTARNHAHRGNHKQYAPMTHQNPQRLMVPAVVLTQSKPVLITAVRPVSTVMPKIKMTRPRHAKTIVTRINSPTRQHINRIPSPKASNSPPRVTSIQASVVNAAQGMQGRWEWKPKCPILDHVSRNTSASMTLKRFDYNDALGRSKVIDSGCSRHITGNMSYLSNFKELNGGYVAFGGNPKGGLENQLSLKVKVIESDNKTEFMNNDLNQFCGMKGIKREFSIPKTPQQNSIAERKNRTFIEAARTMMADSLLPILFWVEAVNTACKFDGKVNEGFLVGYFVSSKAFRVFNSRTQIVQETLHVNFLENKPNVAGSGPTWLFDIDTLTKTINYQPVTTGNQSNPNAVLQILRTLMEMMPLMKRSLSLLKRRVKKLERGNKVKVLKLRRLQKVGTTQRINTSDETVMDDVSNQGRVISDMDVDADVVLEETKDVAADIAKDDQDANVQVDADIQGRTAESQAEIYKIDMDHANKGVVIMDPEESTTTTSIIIHSESKFMDKGKGIMVEEPKTLKKQAQIKQDKKYARELEAYLNRNIDWDEVIDHVNKKAKSDPTVKRMYYDDIRPIFEAKFDSNVAFLQKKKEQIEEEQRRALKRINETPAEKAAKRQKLDEVVKELKRHIQIVPNEDDDVYTEATPLAQKVPAVAYEIYNENNKPYFKIKRADGTHQLYVGFLSFLRNFDREDLEALWSLVKERFATAKPKNFFDDFLLMTLGAMFEKPNMHAQI